MDKIAINASTSLFQLSLFFCDFAFVLIWYLAEKCLIFIFLCQEAFIRADYLFLIYRSSVIRSFCDRSFTEDIFILQFCELEDKIGRLSINLNRLKSFDINIKNKLRAFFDIIFQIYFALNSILLFKIRFQFINGCFSLYKKLIEENLTIF